MDVSLIPLDPPLVNISPVYCYWLSNFAPCIVVITKSIINICDQRTSVLAQRENRFSRLSLQIAHYIESRRSRFNYSQQIKTFNWTNNDDVCISGGTRIDLFLLIPNDDHGGDRLPCLHCYSLWFVAHRSGQLGNDKVTRNLNIVVQL